MLFEVLIDIFNVEDCSHCAVESVKETPFKGAQDSAAGLTLVTFNQKMLAINSPAEVRQVHGCIRSRVLDHHAVHFETINRYE